MEGNVPNTTAMKLLFIDKSATNCEIGYTCDNFTYLFVYLEKVYTTKRRELVLRSIIEKYLESRVRDNRVMAYKFTGIV